MLAETVVAEAQRLAAVPAAPEERAALRRERLRVKASDDWIDQLIVDQMRRHAEQAAGETP